MKIDDKLLNKLEKLSLIEVEDKERLKKDLSEILEFVEILNEIDTSEIDATFNTLNAYTPLREDTPKDSGIYKEVLKHAPKADDNYFIVPKIIEG